MTSASEQDTLHKSSPAQSQTPPIQQTHWPPQVSEESWEDGGYACILVNAESRRADGKRATVSGRGEYLKCDTSSAVIVDRTSASKESHLERTRLPRAVQPWLARNFKALNPESINRSKSARTSSGRSSQKLPHVDSHQSNHDETSQTPESMVSSEETCEADKETERFLASLTFLRVMEAIPGGTEYSHGIEEEEVR